MYKTSLDRVTQYSFSPNTIEGIGHNIYLFESEDVQTIIDPTSTKIVQQMRKAQLLTTQKVRNVVFSHYHNDHCDGAELLPKCSVWGSPLFKSTTENSYSKEMKEKIAPTNPIVYNKNYSFGKNTIRFHEGRGHSICGMLIEINSKYLHINDIVCFTENQIPLLPLIFDSAQEYLKTINTIIDLDLYLLISHSGIIDQSKIKNQLLINKKYIEGIIEHRQSFDLNKFQAENQLAFAYCNLHPQNLNKI